MKIRKKAAQGIQSSTYVMTPGPESHHSLCRKIVIFVAYLNVTYSCNMGLHRGKNGRGLLKGQ